MSEQADTLRVHGVDPETIRAKLLLSSLFLTAYELLKEQIVDRTRAFFSDRCTADGWQPSEEYNRRILAPHPNPFAGSVAWLRELDVLTADDEATLLRIRDQRNGLAHDLPAVVFGRALGIDVELLNATRELVLRVGRFWARVDLDTDEDFAGQEIADEDIQPGAAVMLEYIAQIAAEAVSPAAA